MILSDLSVKRPVFASVISLLLVLFGLVAFTRLPLFSTFDEAQLGELLVAYAYSNLSRYFDQQPGVHYTLLLEGEPVEVTIRGERQPARS